MSKENVRIPDWVSYRAQSTPDQVVVEIPGRRWRFRDLRAESIRVGPMFARRGIGEGDRVALLANNDSRLMVLVHALLRMGAILVPLNVRLTEAELSWQLSDSTPKLLIADEANGPLAERAGANAPGTKVFRFDELERILFDDFEKLAAAGMKQPVSYDPDQVLAIVYTSGTTGRPKGAMLTVGNFWWSAHGSALNLGTTSDDKWLACLPLFHVGGLSILMRAAICGFTAVIHEVFDPQKVNEALDEGGITIVSVVATMLERMLDERGDRPYPPSLRCVLLGGGPAPRSLLERCAAAGIPVVQTYGMTETAPQVVTLSPDDALKMIGSSGKPLFPNEVRIVKENGEDALPDEEGEIIVRGPVVTKGYWRQPEATDRAIVDGWLRTGDIGRLDLNGYLYVLERRDDMIITGGENVYPAEVESALLAHPDVIEAGVIGVPDNRWGQRVVAVVRLSDSADAGSVGESIIAHCRTLLAGYKVPRDVRVAAAPLPRTASGKLHRSSLRDRNVV